MATTEFVCPKCGVTARSPKLLAAGTPIRCPQCGVVFKLDGGDSRIAPSRPASAPRVTPAREAGTGDGQAVRRKPAEPAPTAAERAPARCDDRDDDDRSRSRRRDDRDYDDDRPRRRRRRSKQGSNTVVMGLVAGVAIFLIIVGVVLIAFFVFNNKADKSSSVQVASNNQATLEADFTVQPQRPSQNPITRQNPNVLPPANPGVSIPGPADQDFPPPPPINDAPSTKPAPGKPPDDMPMNSPRGGAPTLSMDTTLDGRPTESRPIIGPPPAKPAGSKPTEPLTNLDRLPPDILSKVKRATVYIRVPIDRGLAMGSGFLAGGAKDIVLTNAHVINMLHANAPPKKIEVVLNSGEKDEATFRGEVLAVDRVADLAVLRIHMTAESKGAVIPEPINIPPTNPLVETQHVFIFGFPRGEELGKNISVAQSSISSLRKTPEGDLDQIQVNGGMTHGNSGGPVVDAAGNLVGVAVAVVEGTQLNFAIPAERVSSILDGRLSAINLGEPVQKSNQMVMAVEVEALDPLQRIKDLTLDWWWGDAKDKIPAIRGAAPAPTAGATPRQTVKLKAAGPNRLTADIYFPRAFPANKVMWLQPHYSNGTEQNLYVQGVSKEVDTPPEPRNATIVFRPRIGTTKVDLKSTNNLVFRAPDGEGKNLVVNIETLMTEQTNGQFPDGTISFRLGKMDESDKFAVGFSLDGKTARVRPEMQSAIKNINRVALDYTMDRNGNVVATQPMFSGAPQEAVKGLTRLAHQIGRSMDFTAVTFPNAQVRPGQRWYGQRQLPLMTLEEDISIDTNVLYTYRGIRKVNGRDMAVIAMTSRIQDAAGRAANLVGSVNGSAMVDVAKGQVAKATVAVDSTISIRIRTDDGKVDTVQARCRLDVKMTRQ